MVVPVDVPFLGDRQGDWLHLVLGLVCLVEVGLWKLDLDLVRHQWCRDHEDDQQHQQHVDKRNDVDVGLRRAAAAIVGTESHIRSEEHTSELQSLMRKPYAVFCLKKTNSYPTIQNTL